MKFPKNGNCPEVKNGLGVPFSRMENMALMRGCGKGSESVSFGAHYCGLPLSLGRRFTTWFIKSRTDFLNFNAYCWLVLIKKKKKKCLLLAGIW
jgi:hypothetical protein